MEYTISKEKGSSRYYIHRVNEKTPVPGTTGLSKKQALHRAASLNGMEYKDYMKARKKEGVSK